MTAMVRSAPGRSGVRSLTAALLQLFRSSEPAARRSARLDALNDRLLGDLGLSRADLDEPRRLADRTGLDWRHLVDALPSLR